MICGCDTVDIKKIETGELMHLNSGVLKAVGLLDYKGQTVNLRKSDMVYS